MGNLMTNLRQVFLNFKQSPKKALMNSYQFTASNETSLGIIVLLGLLAGFGNLMGIKYAPITALRMIDISASKNKALSISSSFKKIYKPELGKYFMLGLVLLCVVLIICAVISYAARTNMFKTKESFLPILKATSLHLIPALILFFIAGILATTSFALYIIFLILSFMAFVVYFFEHLRNISRNTNDTFCFITSITVLAIIIIIFKYNVNSEFLKTFMNSLVNLLEDSLGGLFN